MATLSIEEIAAATVSGWGARGFCFASGFGSAGMWLAVGDRSSGADRLLKTEDLSAFAFVTTPAAVTYNGIAYSPTLNRAAIIGVGNTSLCWTDDAITVSAAVSTPVPSITWTAICWWELNALFVAVGTNRVMTSPDGKNWTLQTAASGAAWGGVIDAGSAVVAHAVKTSGASTQLIMRATDASAATWALVTTANAYLTENSSASVRNASCSVLARNSDSGRLILPVRDNSGSTRLVIVSDDDGTSWAEKSIPNATDGHQLWGAVWYGGERFYCQKGNGSIYIASDDDGETWTETTISPSPSQTNYSSWSYDQSLGVIVSPDRSGSAFWLVGTFTDVGTVSPSFGPSSGGTVVTITGAGLASVAQGDVLFDSTAALSVTPAADGLSLTCITPAHAVGLVDVVVTGIGTLTGAYTFVSITRVTPRRGTYAGGQAVTITGFGFDLATGVTFDGISAGDIVYVSNTSITATTPVHGAGFVDVEVVGVGTLTAGYEFIIPVDELPPQPYYTPVRQDGKPNGDLISSAWSKWLDLLKQRAENPVLGPSTQVPASNVIGVLNENNIPSLPFTRIDLTHSPRLLGRTSSGAGPAEEITVVGGLTLNNGQLSIFGLIGGFTIGDLLYADSVATLARLNDVSVGSYLRSGGVATAPLWSTLKLPNAATAGSVVFASATNTYGQDNAHLFWDDANDRLGIGTATPLSTLQVNSAQTGAGATGIVNVNASAVAADLNLINAMTPNMAVSNRTWVNWGVSATTGNAASLGFFYAGSNNAANRVDIATWGATNPQVSIYNTGRVDITNSTSATNNNLLNVFAASSGTGTTSWLNVGVSATTGNASSIGFFYVSNNAATNRLDFAVYGAATPQLSLSNSGNVGIASTTFPATGTGGLVFSDGTALASMASNTAAIYAEDVAGTVKMFAIAEDGTGGEILTTVSTIPYTSIVSVPTATVLGRNSLGTGAAEALSTLPSAVQLNITSTGALNAGSITSGFGSIDVGADSITGGAASFSTLALSGLITSTGSGVNTFNAAPVGDQGITIRHTAAGTTNRAYLLLGNDSGNARAGLELLSSTYTTNNSLIPDAMAVIATGVGGMSINSTNASTGDVRVYSRNVLAATWGASQALNHVGNVGIGGAPSVTLHVQNATTPAISVQNTGAGGEFATIVAGTAGSGFGFSDTGYFVIGRIATLTTFTPQNDLYSSGGFVVLGGTGIPGGGSTGLIFTQGTALSSMASNTVGLNAVDVGGTAQLFGINEANETARLTGLIARNSAQFDKAANTTLANVTGLTRDLAAGLTYYFEAFLNVSADAAGGSKFAISGTATVTSIYYAIELLDFVTNTLTIADIKTTIGTSSEQVGTTVGRCLMRGVITVNAAGTLTAQYAQSIASGTSSILANSIFKIAQVT